MTRHFSALLAALAVWAVAVNSATAQSQGSATNGLLVASGTVSGSGHANIPTVAITSASVSVYSSGIATFSVTFAPGTSLAAVFAQFELDTDQNPATGYPGRDGANSDRDLIGGDFWINIYGSAFGSNAVVNGSSFPVDYSGNTIQVSVPLATLGNSDGLMNFGVVASKQLTDNSFSYISDYAPALRQPVGVVALVGTTVGTGTASRSMPATYTAGTSFTVSITVTPNSAVQSYSVQDMPPANWTVSAISNNGSFDAATGLVHWGPFTANAPQTLTYGVSPTPTVGAAATFSGTATFDSTVTVPITGQRSISSVTVTPGGTGTQAPRWVLPSIDGTTIDSTSYAGKVVLLNFWATWCGPCVGEIPDLISLQRQYGPDGLVVVGISVDDNGSTPPTSLLQSFVSANHMSYPIVMTRPNGLNVESAYGGISAIPTTFIIDRQNNIVKTFVGSQSFATFEQAVTPLLAAGPPTLSISLAGGASGNVALSWPTNAGNYVLQATLNSVEQAGWASLTNAVTIDGASNRVTLPVASSIQFFRLKSQ